MQWSLIWQWTPTLGALRICWELLKSLEVGLGERLKWQSACLAATSEALGSISSVGRENLEVQNNPGLPDQNPRPKVLTEASKSEVIAKGEA
jgi:hypothetical protein